MINKSWEILHNYESHDLVKRKYDEIHRCAVNAAKVNEICSCFTQAREYFASALQSDKTIKPLLLYYGVTSLTRGLTFFKNKTAREATLKAGHGLSHCNWQEIFANKSLNFASIKVKINKSGTLRDFCSITNNTTLLSLNCSVITHSSVNPSLDQGKEYQLTLDDLLSRIPELCSQYTQAGGDSNFLLGNFEAKNEKIIFKLNKQQFDNLINEKIIREFFGTYIEDMKEDDVCFIITTLASFPFLSWDFINDSPLGIGCQAIVSPFSSDCHLSKPVATFMLSYILGMLVRYYPSRWMALVRNEKGDAIFPTLLKSISYIETRFPQMIVDLLTYEKVSV